MTRDEAIAIVQGDPAQIVEVLLHLSARIEDLERRLAQLTKDWSNSSKPPSTDGPSKKSRPLKPKKSRKRNPGGQPGHKGSNRDLVPVEDVERVLPVSPERCETCGTPFPEDGAEDADSGTFLGRQVVDIPPIKPIAVEYRLRCRECACGAKTWARMPSHAKSALGPRLSAVFAYFTSVHRVTRRGCREIAKSIFGIDIALGSVCGLHEEVAQALAPACDEIKEALVREPVLNIDETGWKYKAPRSRLRVLRASATAYFAVSASRGAKVLKEILGEVHAGVIRSDMFSAYNAYHKGLRQLCRAHIIRHVKGIKHGCRNPAGARFAKWMLTEIGRMFGLWHACKKGPLDRRTLVRKSVRIRARMNRYLNTYAASADEDASRQAKCLLEHWDHLFTFLEHEGVEPTNNSAEQSVRPVAKDLFRESVARRGARHIPIPHRHPGVRDAGSQRSRFLG
jgi:transposase